MAQLSATESLTSCIGAKTHSLFEISSEDVKEALGKFSTKKQFSVLARDFFSNFMKRYLNYFLSREISNHVGAERRFSNVDEHNDFNEALNLHCRQISKIVEDFSGGWYSKTNYEGGVTRENTAQFLHVALKKIKSEFLRE